jgi:hypothetical protein
MIVPVAECRLLLVVDRLVGETRRSTVVVVAENLTVKEAVRRFALSSVTCCWRTRRGSPGTMWSFGRKRRQQDYLKVFGVWGKEAVSEPDIRIVDP